ncbi:MAG: hypothetical protein AB9834_05160 [Lentimicrobium sp.]
MKGRKESRRVAKRRRGERAKGRKREWRKGEKENGKMESELEKSKDAACYVSPAIWEIGERRIILNEIESKDAMFASPPTQGKCEP